MKIKTLIMSVLLAAITAVTGCQGARTDLIPQDAPPPADLTERFVHQTIQDLKDRFVSGDVPGFMKHVSDGFYGGRRALEDDLIHTVSSIDDVDLNVTIGDITIEDTKISATLAWSSTFLDQTSGLQESRAGRTELIFHKAETISLVDILRDPLFGIEGIQGQ